MTIAVDLGVKQQNKQTITNLQFIEEEYIEDLTRVFFINKFIKPNGDKR